MLSRPVDAFMHANKITHVCFNIYKPFLYFIVAKF